jgi:cell division protein FtsN
MEELKELRGWERAQFRDRIDNYQRFLEQHPDSENAAAAQRRIFEIERDAAWTTAQDSGDAQALQNFLAEYPDAPQAWEAEQLLASLAPALPEEAPAPPPERPGNFRLQLGAFRTAAAADSEVRRLAPLFARTLPGPVRIVTPVETGGRFFLLQSAPVNRKEADEACARLQTAGQACLRINR